MRILRFCGAGAVVALTACAGSLVAGRVPEAGALKTGLVLQAGATTAAPGLAAGTGQIVMHIDWPRQAQTIPLAAQDPKYGMINVFATATGSVTPVASTSVQYPTASATLSALPAGTYWVTAQALQLPGETLLNGGTTTKETVVSLASQSVAVAANQQSSTSLTMVDTVPPSIASIATNYGSNIFWVYPSGTLSGVQLVIKGYGLMGFGDATPTVYVGSSTESIVTMSYGGGGSNQDMVQVDTPSSWNGLGNIELVVDGLQAIKTSAGLIMVATASITPDPATAVSRSPLGNTETFSASASDVSGNQVLGGSTGASGSALPGVSWGLAIGGGADPSQMAQCGGYVGSFGPVSTAGTLAVMSQTATDGVEYYASSSIPIPDSSTCTNSSGTALGPFSNAAVNLSLSIGGNSAVKLPITIN